jgi:hypothetical protein
MRLQNTSILSYLFSVDTIIAFHEPMYFGDVAYA